MPRGPRIALVRGGERADDRHHDVERDALRQRAVEAFRRDRLAERFAGSLG
jgi:hypothetical protein